MTTTTFFTRRRDLTGQKFGRLTALAPAAGNRWTVSCECGNPNPKPVRTAGLLSGNTKSCGCLRKENTGRHAKVGERENFIDLYDFINHTYPQLEAIKNFLFQHDVKFQGDIYVVRGKAYGPYKSQVHAIAAAMQRVVKSE
jgi:hypothetical protein